MYLLLSILAAAFLVFGVSACASVNGERTGEGADAKAEMTAEEIAKADAIAKKAELEQMEAEEKARAKAAEEAAKEEAKRVKAEKKAAEKAAKEEAKRLAAEKKAAEKAAKEEAKRLAAEKKAAEEAAEKAAEEEAKRLAAEKKAAEKAAKEEAKRLAAEKKAAEEAAEKAAKEEAKRLAAEKKAAEEAAAKAAEEEAVRLAAEKKAAEEAAAKAAEEEAARLAAERKAAEEEAKRLAAEKKAAEEAAAKAAKEEAARLAAERKAAEQAAAEKAEAELKLANADYKAAVDAYTDGELEQAKALFTGIVESKVSLGKSKDAAVEEYLNRISSQLQSLVATRAAAAANVQQAEGLMKEGKWEAAKVYLDRAVADEKSLSAEDRIKMAGLVEQVQAAERAAVDAAVAAEKRATLDKEAVDRANEIIKIEKDKIKVIAEQHMAAADHFVAVAKAEYDNLNFDAALMNVNKALEQVPNHEEALALRLDIRAITGSDEEPYQWIRDIVSDAQKVRLEMAHNEMHDAIKKGKSAYDSEDFDTAVKEFTSASEILEYLRQYADIRGVEAQLDAMLANAKREQVDAEKKLAAAREYEGIEAAREDARLQAQRQEQALVQLYRDASKQFARGNYESAIERVEDLLANDPGNIPAKELYESTRAAMKRLQWEAIYEAKDQAVEDERVILAEKLIFPAHTLAYPAKEVWDEIKERSSIMDAPDKGVRLSEKEQDLERILDIVIPSFSFDETPLEDVVGYFRMQPEFENVNFVIDTDRLLRMEEIYITRSLNDLTLRQALKTMLTPRGLNYVISNDSIFISTAQGCVEEEASGENMYFWQYDVRDLLVDLEAGGGGNGNSDDGGNSSSGNSSSSSSGNNGDDDDGGGSEGDLVELITLFTGPQNWDIAGSFSGGDDGNDDGGSGGGISGGGGGDIFGGGGGGYGGDALGTAGEALGLGSREGPGRLMILRNGYLMVNHVDRLHKAIQTFLTDLRAQIIIQVQIEGRYVTYTDQFYKDIGINWGSAIENGPAFSFYASGRGFIPDLNVNINPFSPEANVADPGISTTGGLTATLNFFNSTQTQAIISAVKNSKNATTVAAPHVVVMDTEEQELELVTTGYYISGYEVDDTGNFALPIIEPYDRSSISMTVTPVVSADRRYVTMSVSLSLSGGTPIPTGTVSIPIAAGDVDAEGVSVGTAVPVTFFTIDEFENDIESLVRVPDRGTLVLGGLSNVEESTGQKSIPILCHIPILKRLVTRDAVSKNRTHNIFMVTPTIMLPEEIEP